jgi:sulfate adenylyltransferase subunit 1
VAISLADDVDISRGCMIVKEGEEPHTGNNLTLLLCWLNHKPLALGTKYIIRHATDEVIGMVKEVEYKMNINTLEKDYEHKDVQMNDIARVTLRTAKPLNYDAYRDNRGTGSLILIDSGTFETIGAGMIEE